MNNDATKRQIKLFEAGGIWKGGYFEGDPLDPMSASTYSILGYMSILHATYLACIKPYVNANTRVLEIGPGRGAWTRTFLNAQEVVCLDALSAEHNGFWEYVGRTPNVQYFKVDDFTCNCVPDEHFNYFFSFGCFCHISPAGSREYFKNLHRKLISGSHGFVMIADFEKRSKAAADIERLSGFRVCDKKRYWPARFLWRLIYSLHPSDAVKAGVRPVDREDRIELEEANPERAAGRFQYLGIERGCQMLRDAGFEIADPDVGTIHRDAIVHFIKR
jgi:phospholipid N-methyltransferase